MNTAREELYQRIPLEVPFSIHVFPSYYCNFRCNYCLHSLSETILQKKGFRRQFMDFLTFEKTVDDAKTFGSPIKALIFAGHGEPLLHKNIAEMVAYAKKSGCFERVEIVTNGFLLTKELSDRLIEAGLDRLRVSLQGLTAQSYRDVSGVDIDFEQFRENLAYFYRNKVATEVYIKIIDIALKCPEEKNLFYEQFSPIADIAAIEYAIPFVNEIDYSSLGELSKKNKQGHIGRSNVCSMPFYMLVVAPNGDVLPCCATDVPLVFGNVKESGLKEIWNSNIRRGFLCEQLRGVKGISVCDMCSVPSFGLQEGDYLDGHEDELMERIVNQA